MTVWESWCFKFNPERKRQWRGINLPRQKKSDRKNRASRQCWSLFRSCRYYPPRFCSCRHHCVESLLFCSVDVCTWACAVSETAVPKQRLAALTRQGARLHGRWMWIYFLLPNRSVWPSIPPTCHIGHLQIFPLLEGEWVLKGRHFSDISDIQLGVTELLKGIELQDFQRTFEDLCKRSQCCVELVRFYRKVCKTSKYIHSFFFRNKYSLFVYWAHHNKSCMNANQCFVIPILSVLLSVKPDGKW